jgi:outer membrane protein
VGFAAALFIATVVGCALSSRVGAETLADTLLAAYETNPRLEAARATLRATDEEVPRAISGYRPSITSSADTGFQKTVTTPSGGAPQSAVDQMPRGYTVGLVQPLFRGFRTLNAVNAAEATVRAGREILRTTEQAVLLDAVTAYGDVVRDGALVRMREGYLALLTRDATETQDRFRIGELAMTDVAQTQARRAGAVAALDRARADLRTSRATFERLVGHPPHNLSPAQATNLVPKSLHEGLAIALRENPNVVGALYNEQAARFAVEQIKGELLPTVQLEANYTKRFDTTTPFNGMNVNALETSAVTGRVTVPFYSGGEVEARVRQAKHNHVQRIQQIEQARTEVQAQVVAAWSQLLAAKAAVHSDQVAVAANHVAVTGVRTEEHVGQRKLLDVLNAEQELLAAAVNLVTDQRNLMVASYTVLSVIGRLNAQEVTTAPLVYDPEEHYQDVRGKWFDITITFTGGRREVLQASR